MYLGYSSAVGGLCCGMADVQSAWSLNQQSLLGAAICVHRGGVFFVPCWASSWGVHMFAVCLEGHALQLAIQC